jgi:hypothetical protein
MLVQIQRLFGAVNASGAHLNKARLFDITPSSGNPKTSCEDLKSQQSTAGSYLSESEIKLFESEISKLNMLDGQTKQAFSDILNSQDDNYKDVINQVFQFYIKIKTLITKFSMLVNEDIKLKDKIDRSRVKISSIDAQIYKLNVTMLEAISINDRGS